MTNSCVSSKWLPHIQTGSYGMSQNCIDESKEYIFVKLTDSAYRAVEEYQKNETKCSARAKIQVIGNGGIISFPTTDDNEGQKFGFAIDDIEGSFECIKQTENDLNVLGTLPCKIRIQANDDVYEKTRHRMAVAEETQKNKCTREIKPNQTDIGRKVKLKNIIGSSGGGGGSGSGNSGGGVGGAGGASINGGASGSSGSGSGGVNISNGNISNGNVRNGFSSGVNSNGNIGNVLPNKRELTTSNSSPLMSNSNSVTNNPLKISTNSRSPNPSLSSSRSSNNNNSSSSNLVGMPTSASSLSSALSSAAGSGTSGISNGYLRSNSPEMKLNSSSKNAPNLAAGNNRTKGKGAGSGIGGNGGPNNNRHKGNDVTKRNIRERLIHLLALKPFKKPELFSRLQNEGIRDKERSLIITILKEISNMRDNLYNLKRAMWNEVNENWQFYTEQELQMLKRRKPQNLTPPLSSDAGSSTSGQSPTSTHNGSPPPAVKRPTSLDNRERCYEEPTAKKQRISHFKKDTSSSSSAPTASLLAAPSTGNEKNQNTSSNQNHIDTDDNSMDLSYAVLDNDDFMAGLTANSRRSGAGGGVQTASGGLKMYHNNNNKSPYNEAVTAGIGKNASPYNNTTTSGNNNNNSSSSNGWQQAASPGALSNSSPSINNNNNNNKQNSVIYSPSQQQQQQQQQTTTNQSTNHSSSYGHLKSQQQQQYTHHHPQQQQPPPPPPPPQQQQQQPTHHYPHQQLARPSQQQQQSKQSQPQQLHQQHQPQQQQQHHHHHPKHASQPQQSQQHVPLQQQQQQQQSQIQPQQNPDEPIVYDFRKYPKITSIEQRRRYKTEFENDYAEYRQLLSQIDNVGKRFQMLAARLQSARNDADYRNIKRQIVHEYERIRNEKAHQRDKLRFDYLHEKLAHIKALVSDYDKMLTATAGGTVSQHQSTTPVSPDLMAANSSSQQHQHLTNGNPATVANAGNEHNSNFYPQNKMYLTPSPPLQRIDGAGGGGGGGGGSGGGGGNGNGILENGPAIQHNQQHRMMATDDDAY